MKRTLRDLLIHQYRPMEARIDKARERALSAVARPDGCGAGKVWIGSAGVLTWLGRCMDELVWAARWGWGAIGTAWLVILMLNLVAREQPDAGVPAIEASARQWMAVWIESGRKPLLIDEARPAERRPQKPRPDGGEASRTWAIRMA